MGSVKVGFLDGLGSIPHYPLPKTKFDLKLTGPGGRDVFIGPHALLPADKVRHVGEAVAMVVAETYVAALDACEHVEIAYEELPFALTAEQVMERDTSAVWTEVPDNVLVDTQFGDLAATDAAFAVVEGEDGLRHVSVRRGRRQARSA